MADSTLSRKEKDKVKEKLRTLLGHLFTPKSRRKDWLVNQKANLSVFVTFSRSDQLFYDISQRDLDLWQSEYKQAFVVFVVGEHDKVLIIPVNYLAGLLKSREVAEDGTFKLHLQKTRSGYYFREALDRKLDSYYNKYSLLQMS